MNREFLRSTSFLAALFPTAASTATIAAQPVFNGGLSAYWPAPANRVRAGVPDCAHRYLGDPESGCEAAVWRHLLRQHEQLWEATLVLGETGPIKDPASNSHRGQHMLDVTAKDGWAVGAAQTVSRSAAVGG